MIVASTIAGSDFQPLRAQVPLHLVEQPPTQIVLFEKVTEAAHRSLIRHWLAAQVDAYKPPHRRRIVKCLFDRRV